MLSAIAIFLLAAIASCIWYVRTAHRGPLRGRIHDWWIGPAPDDDPPSFLDRKDGL